MRPGQSVGPVAAFAIGLLVMTGGVFAQPVAGLPPGVKAVWDVGKAYRESTPTRERICINGLWLWQPAADDAKAPPSQNWGYFKVPGCWPGITDYMQKDCQTVFAHPYWSGQNLGAIKQAWYEREITVPADWAGRHIVLSAEYVNSYAAVWLDGVEVGEILFPAGEVDLTNACRPGSTHRLSLLVVAMPLRGVMLSYSDTASAREVQGSVARRGLCGDVYLCSFRPGPRVGDLRVNTSLAQGEVTFSVALQDLAEDSRYALRIQVAEAGQTIEEFTSRQFGPEDLHEGRFESTAKFVPPKLWDIHTPANQYDVTVSLLDAAGTLVDTGYPVRTGFRDFRIQGRDFYLNGSRLYLSAVPLDNAQVGAAWATYEGARESLLRLQSFGINFVYTHNYGCEPGTHLSFAEILRAADDVGMLVALSQPHFGQYDWKAPDADENNSYARHAAFYVGVAGSHPSVVMYAMSHNATGYSEDMNPDRIDGLSDPRDSWAANNAKLALRAEAIVSGLDPTRIVYHHSSGNLSSMHTTNFYTNFAPIQELSDWFEHWATVGVKPVFTCEYMVPCTWDWTMYRGWYKGARAFGSALVPWEFCVAEWNSQFLGDQAFRISQAEKSNLRWEAEQFRTGRLWHRWDYPFEVGSRELVERYPIIAAYLTDNWRAFRTWGVSAISPWEWGHYWKLRDGVNRGRQELPVDWDNLQRPGFSPDYIEERYERVDLAYDRDDWVAMPPAQALLRNNRPLLAYIGGKPARFTSKDHNFVPGETLEKQLILINNSREEVSAECTWTLDLPRPVSGNESCIIPTGDQRRIPLRFELPKDLPPGSYTLRATAAFSTGEAQEDEFMVHVMPPVPLAEVGEAVAVWDPVGDTAALLRRLQVRFQPVEADADLSRFATLIIGKGALTVDGKAPDIGRVRDGLKVIVFEQSSQALEQRLGFRTAEYGLRQVFPRVPDHPLLAGLSTDTLRDWRGEATLLPPRLEYESSPRFAGAPTVQWCGIEVTRVWRCGCRGNVASVLIEKPARGDFLPIVDGGYSLQYSPLMEYREGEGVVLFCQMDVSGRTEWEPAADTLARNILRYIATWKPSARRGVVYVGEAAGKKHLESMGLVPRAPQADLSTDDVLIIGPGGAQELAGRTSAVGTFLRKGGNVLALGLDETEARACLPVRVGMTEAEHIGCYFDPAPAGSLLQGIGPADVHNRAPRQLPLVTSGVEVIGDGVLAQASDANVVFCQLVPFHINPAGGAVTRFVVDEKEAFEGSRSAMVSLGAVSETGAQFGQAVKFEPEVGKTYTLAVFVKGVGGPVSMHLEIERAGRPWDRAIKAPNVVIPADQWTDLHVSFQCETAFPEGWQAYIGCAQPGAQFRADLFRLYEGQYVPWQADAVQPRNLFANAGFESGEKPWFFMFNEQQNLRRTYRRSSFLLTRLLANMGAAGETPLLSRFLTPADEGQEPTGDSVVRNGDFSRDADGDEMPDEWQFSSDSTEAVCTREQTETGFALRLALPGYGGKERANVMLAQHDVPVREGQWYRISVKAKAEGLTSKRIALAIQNTTTWTSFFEYQYFAPEEKWRNFDFVVQSNGTASDKTRFQIWHENLGTLWLAYVQMWPISGPVTKGRWNEGLYLDQPQEWDDPYRFFRW